MTKVLAGRILLAICIGISGLDYFGQTGATPLLGTWFSKAGKEAGNLAMYGGIAAGCLYVSRELFSWLKKRKEPVASIGAGYLQKIWEQLRAWHVFLGYAAVSLAFLHGYVMLMYRSRKIYAVYSGEVAAAVVLLLFIGGNWLYKNRRSLTLRKWHKTSALVVAIAVVAHKMLE